MKTYEITFITKEDEREKPVKTILEGLSGKILNISSLGQKTFAYQIKKEKVGFFTTVSFEIPAEKVADLNKKLSMEEEILRFLIISIKPNIQMAELPVKEEKKTEIIEEPAKEIIPEPVKEIVEITEKQEEKAPETEKVKEAKPKKTAKPKAEKPKKVSKAVKELLEEPTSEEERMEALDKKLEELLKE